MSRPNADTAPGDQARGSGAGGDAARRAARAAPARTGARRRPASPLGWRLARSRRVAADAAHRSWERLGRGHELLCGQPPRHGGFFAWLDRLLHEHGRCRGRPAAQLVADEPHGEAAAGAGAYRAASTTCRPPTASAPSWRVVDRLRLQAVAGRARAAVRVPAASRMQHCARATRADRAVERAEGPCSHARRRRGGIVRRAAL